MLALTTALVVLAAAPNAPCDGARLSLVRDRVDPRGTGVSAVMLQVTNRGATPCLLARRPRLELLDRSGAIPFVFTYARRCALSCGRVRSITPNRPVVVNPRRSVYVGFDSYRCDSGARRIATAVRIAVGSTTLEVALPSSRPAVAWCGRGDPGSIVNMSPYEQTPMLAAQRA